MVKMLSRYGNIKYLFGALLVIVSFTSLYQIYGEVMVAPNSYLLSSEGEAARVYYVFASHAKSDSTYVHFQGMNYPYGEHLVFCDAQPLVANSFRWVAQFYPHVVEYAVGIQNFISLYGLLLGALLLYVFLLRWNMAPWYAALVAYSLMMISPQVLRMPWQPSLAYFFFIPLMLVLFQKYVRKPELKWTLIIALVNLMAYFLNPYLGVISTLFFGMVMFYILVEKGWKKWKYYVNGFVQSLLPGILYQYYVQLTDLRIDRVELPTGLHEFTATLSTIFTSPYSPLKTVYTNIGVDMLAVQQHFEGMAYVGVSTTLLLVFYLVLRIRNKKLIEMNTEQKILFVSAVLFFILSIGFPFVFHPFFEKLLQLVKPLRQLRAFGRLAWMVVFCVNLVVFSLLYALITKRITSKKKQYLAYAIAVCLLLFTVYEGTYLHDQVSTHQQKGNVFTRAGLKKSHLIPYIDKALDQINTEKYAAIVPIPFFHVGSELFVTPSHTTYRAMLEVIAFAYHSNLPLTASYLSRLSVEESKKALQFFAPPMIKKEIAKDYNNKRPLLFFYSKSTPKPSAEELRLLDLGKKIYETDEIALVEVYPQQIWEQNNDKIFSWYQDYKDKYTQSGNLYYYGDNQPIHISFNHLDNTLGLEGAAFVDDGKEKKYFFDQLQGAKAFKVGSYELSFWMEASINRMQSTLILEKINDQGEMIKEEALLEAKRSFTIDGNWVRWQQIIQLDSNYNIRLYMKQPTNYPGVFIHNLFFIPEKRSVFIQDGDKNWWWNNYPLSLN